MPQRLSWLLRMPVGRQFLKFCLVSLASNGTAFLAYLLLCHLGLSPKYAMTITYWFCVGLSFLGQRRLTFQGSGPAMRTGVRYVLAYLAAYGLNFGALTFFADIRGYPHYYVQLGVIPVIAVFLFASMKYFVFASGNATRNTETEKSL